MNDSHGQSDDVWVSIVRKTGTSKMKKVQEELHEPLECLLPFLLH